MVHHTEILDFADPQTTLEFTTGKTSYTVDADGVRHDNCFHRIELTTGRCLEYMCDEHGDHVVENDSVKVREVQLRPPLKVVDARGDEFVPRKLARGGYF